MPEKKRIIRRPQPVYKGKVGSVPVDTSRQREEAETEHFGKRTTELLDLLAKTRTGLTWFEADQELGWGHGTISGTLSNLERAGSVFRAEGTKRGEPRTSYVYFHRKYADKFDPRKIIRPLPMITDVLHRLATALEEVDPENPALEVYRDRMMVRGGKT